MNKPFFIPITDLEDSAADSELSHIAKVMVEHSQGLAVESREAPVSHKPTSPSSFNSWIPAGENNAEGLFDLTREAPITQKPSSPSSFNSWIPAGENNAEGLFDLIREAPITQKPSSPRTFNSWIPPVKNNTERLFDVNSIRKDFPILSTSMIWFDNAATTQKPTIVMQKMDAFLKEKNSNIHRGAHRYAKLATELYEEARKSVAQFIHASSEKEIIFVRGSTEGINLVAHSFGENFIQPGDEIVISYLEHHSNILPWQILARKKGARLRVIPIDKQGNILMDEYARLLSHKTKMVALTQVANSIGTVVPVGIMAKMAKSFGAHVLIDAAQSIPHFDINVQDLECDFLIFSGHKIYGPTGIGVVYGKEALLHLMPPYQTGGGMIEDVTFEYASYAPGHAKFEAGTPNVVGAIGLKAALDYIQQIGLKNIAHYEKTLVDYALNAFTNIPGLELIGMPKERVSVVSFVLDGVSKESLAKILDERKIALRMGHHCALPTVRFFGHESTIRPSFALYNTKEEIDLLVDILKKHSHR